MASRQNEWNKKNLDSVSFFVKKGAREKLKQIAAEQGYTMAGYIKHAIIKCAENDGYGDIQSTMGGGGALTLNAFRTLVERF